MSYIYLDNFNQSYKKIIIVNSNPNDSDINEIIKIIPKRKKSIFDYPSMYEKNPYCVYAFLNPNDKSQFISVDDIDILLSYLIKKNYKVLIVEDVITTGKSSLECVKLIKKSKGVLLGFACLIDRSNKKTLKIKDKKIISQIKLSVPLFKKNNLPINLKKIPITSPGSRYLK